jgi:hypothetical protein
LPAAQDLTAKSKFCGGFYISLALLNRFKSASWLLAILLGLGAFCPEAESASRPPVVIEGGKTYMVDRTGERWDITQARSLGFGPEHFEFGLGRNAFTPLDDSLLGKPPAAVPADLRVIGVAEGSQARAYSIERLSRHEIANSSIGDKPIAVAY